MEAQDRGVWPEDFGASTSTSRMRDVARRRREAEEKLAHHLFATEPQLRPAILLGEEATTSAALPGTASTVPAERHLYGTRAPAAPEEPKAAAEPAGTPE